MRRKSESVSQFVDAKPGIIKPINTDPELETRTSNPGQAVDTIQLKVNE